jgi:hypothetical protein
MASTIRPESSARTILSGTSLCISLAFIYAFSINVVPFSSTSTLIPASFKETTSKECFESISLISSILWALLLATIASKILKKPINREKLYAGNFQQELLNKLKESKEWAEEKGKGLIKTLELKKYRMADIINRVELYRPKGYKKLIIDTFKPDRSQSDMARWEAFSNSAQELHDIIKEDNNNVGTLATVQLKLGKETRYLDLDSVGKSMEIVEVASVVMMGRLIFADEYPNEKHALKPYNYKKDELTGEWYIEQYELDPNKEYLILFLAKNRFGSEDEQIIYEVHYDINSFKEVAFVKVPRIGSF